jgi:hypothetical protein
MLVPPGTSQQVENQVVRGMQQVLLQSNNIQHLNIMQSYHVSHVLYIACNLPGCCPGLRIANALVPRKMPGGRSSGGALQPAGTASNHQKIVTTYFMQS